MLHQRCESTLDALQEQVIVVVHEAVRVTPAPVALARGREYLQEIRAIRRIDEDRPTCDAPRVDVEVRTRLIEPQRPRHGGSKAAGHDVIMHSLTPFGGGDGKWYPILQSIAGDDSLGAVGTKAPAADVRRQGANQVVPD
jgi:hypothetical protein